MEKLDYDFDGGGGLMPVSRPSHYCCCKMAAEFLILPKILLFDACF
jgi:hypothetical protein